MYLLDAYFASTDKNIKDNNTIRRLTIISQEENDN
jgi:hypothetical protein